MVAGCSAAEPSRHLGGVRGDMDEVTPDLDSVSVLFERDHDRLVAGLAVAFGAEAAADAVQEAFIAADRRWSKVRVLDDPAGWVRRVALNRLLNGRRNRHRRADILAMVRPVSTEDLTDDLLDLQVALRAMPPRMRAIVCLFHVCEFRIAEIADALDVAEGTVKSTLHTGRERLREQLAVPNDA
jgi:RNA polymerase sigma-70 factor, ECF subfamily